MTLIISCDRYHIKNDQIMIPIMEKDSYLLGDMINDPWVLVTNDTTILQESRYDREENIEDIHRVNAAYNLEKDIYLTTPFDTMNGMKPQYCTRYSNTTITVNSDIDPESKIIGPLGNFVESIVSKKYNNANNYAEKTYITPYLQRYNKIIDVENEKSLKELYDYIICSNSKKLFVKNPYHKDASGIVDTKNILEKDKYDLLFVYRLLENNPIFESWLYQTPRQILVQEEMIMNYETRFFIVNSNIVSVSGRVIDFVPTQESVKNPFYYARKTVKHQSHSNDNQEVIVNPHYDPMVEYVKDMVKTIENNEKSTVTCVIDIAWSPEKNSPVLVEINNISNSGLYGCSAHAIYNALYDNDCYQGLTLKDCRNEIKNMFNNVQKL